MSNLIIDRFSLFVLSRWTLSLPHLPQATTKRVDDSHWHTVTLRRTSKSGRVTVDESAVDFIAPGQSSQLDLEGPLYLGGIGVSSSSHKLPAELWAGSLGFGFVGCVRDVVLNDQSVDVADLARKQDSGGVRPACHTSSSHCHINVCLNGGMIFDAHDFRGH